MFHENKATAMAVYFLKSAPEHKLNFLVLMKLMVITERKCMEQTTSLITGARFVSMKDGPVLSEVLDRMQEKKSSALWCQCIQFEDYKGVGAPSNHCILKCDLDVAEYLSDFEIDLLKSVWMEYGLKEEWTLVELTRTFPEWDKSCAHNQSSCPIALEDIFRLGFHESPELAIERAKEIEYFDKVAA